MGLHEERWWQSTSVPIHSLICMLCHPLVCGCADHCACLLVHSVCILYNYCAKHACHSQHCISSVLLYPHVFRRTDLGVHIRMSSALYHMQCHMSYPVYSLIGLQPSHRVRVYMHVSIWSSSAAWPCLWPGLQLHMHCCMLAWLLFPCTQRYQHATLQNTLSSQRVSVKCAYVWQTMYAIVTCPLQLPNYTFRHATYMGSHPNRLLKMLYVSMRQLATESVKYDNLDLSD